MQDRSATFAPTPPLFEIRDTPNSGRAIFAIHSIPADTLILLSSSPPISVLLREYRREVCGQCFAYAQGRDLQFRDPSVGFVFCAEACRDAWRFGAGEVGVKAWTAVETLVKKRAKEDSKMVDVGLPRPGVADIESAWEAVAVQAALIKIARQGEWDRVSNLSKAEGIREGKSVQVTKQHTRALQKALLQPISPDVLSFCVSGLLCMYNSPLDVAQILGLELDATPYLNADDLRAFTRSYLHLLTILPLPLLIHLTPSNLLLFSTRDSHNAFGIRSLEDDGSEFFGYGCWPAASYFNHSCAPSVVKARAGRAWEFRAGRDIKAGEELCITYLSGEERKMSRDGRREILRGNWGFECACIRCR